MTLLSCFSHRAVDLQAGDAASPGGQGRQTGEERGGGAWRLLAGGERGGAGLGADVDQALAGLEAGQRLGAGQEGQGAAQAQHGRGLVLPCRQRGGSDGAQLTPPTVEGGGDGVVWCGGSTSRNQSRFCVCATCAGAAAAAARHAGTNRPTTARRRRIMQRSHNCTSSLSVSVFDSKH